MRVVIVGSGLAGVTLAGALPARQVTLVTAEAQGYYSRPRLSHGVALDDPSAAKIVMKGYDALGVKVLAETHAALIDRDRRELVLDGGAALDYDILVLATGSASRIPPALANWHAHFLTLNSYDDLLRLRRRRAQVLARGGRPRAAAHWAIIGGGLIGCELASDLCKAGDEVTIFHREKRLIELQLSEPQSQALHEHFAAQNITLFYEQDVRAAFAGTVQTPARDYGPFDGVIVSTGFAPRVELARDAGLAVARGIVVNEYLATADPAIYALGDVAEIGGKLYPFVSPIRAQALWLAGHLQGKTDAPWQPPAFKPVIKVHGFRRDQPARGEALTAQATSAAPIASGTSAPNPPRASA
jgi:NAD(P)H-nitrite reductase large subunit